MWEYKQDGNQWIFLEKSISQQFEKLFEELFKNFKGPIFELRRVQKIDEKEEKNSQLISTIFSCTKDAALEILKIVEGDFEKAIEVMTDQSLGQIKEKKQEFKENKSQSENLESKSSKPNMEVKQFQEKLQQSDQKLEYFNPIRNKESNVVEQYEEKMKTLMMICECEEEIAIDLMISCDSNLEKAVEMFKEQQQKEQKQLEDYSRNNHTAVTDIIYKMFSYPKEEIYEVLVETDFSFDHAIEIFKDRLKKDVQEFSFGDEDLEQYLITDPYQTGMEIQIYKTLTSNQRQALRRVATDAKKLSITHRPNLHKRVIALGFTLDDLGQTLRYVRDTAPIIIHVNLSKYLKGLVNSERYMSQFETNTSSGALSHQMRKQWEDRLFFNAYNKATARERVKYGVLNIVNDPRGVKCCLAYGSSFLLLKNVRLRTTFANADSGGPVQLATCQYYEKVLSEYNDQELRAILECGTRSKLFLDSSVISTYKEVQVHGDVYFNRDVQSLHYYPDELGVGEARNQNLKLLEQFRTKNNVEIIEIEKW